MVRCDKMRGGKSNNVSSVAYTGGAITEYNQKTGRHSVVGIFR